MSNMRRLIALVLTMVMLGCMIPASAAISDVVVRDNSVNGWTFTNTYADTNMYVDASEGDRAVVLQYIEGDVELGGNAQFTQTTPVLKAGKGYTLEFDAKAWNASGVNFQFNWDARQSMTPGPKTYGWTTYKFTYIPAEDITTVIRFIIQEKTDGFWLDNMKFYAMDDPNRENLLVNGDFEQGAGKAWTTVGEGEEAVAVTETTNLAKAQKTTMFAERLTATIDANDDEWKDVEPFPVALKEFFGHTESTGDVTGGEVKFGYDDKNLYFYLEITDTTYYALPDPSWWNNDGIQFATATMTNPAGTRQERGALLYSDGSGMYQSSTDFKVDIKREGDKTIFEAAYPWTVNLGGKTPRTMLFNVSYNNNTGGEGLPFHDCAYSITPGIVAGKNVMLYNPLVLWTALGDVEYGVVDPLLMDTGMTRLHEINLRNPGKTAQKVEISVPKLNYNKTVTLQAGEKQQIQIPFTMNSEEDLYLETILKNGDATATEENKVAVDVIRNAENLSQVVEKLEGYATDLSNLIHKCQEKGIEVEYERSGHAIIVKFIERLQYETANGDFARVFQYEKELKTIYEECKTAMEAYLSGEKEPRHISKYLTSDLKLDGTSVIAKTETNGVIEERPVFLVGYCTWENGPSFMEHFASIGATAIQFSTGFSDFITTIRGGGWSLGGLKESGLTKCQVTSSTEEVYEGNYSMKIVNPDKDGLRNTFRTVTQKFDAKPNTTYHYGFKAKGKGFKAQTKANDSNNAWCNVNGIYSGIREGIAPSEDWVDYDFTYTTGAGEDSLELLLIFGGTIEEIYIDNIFVREEGSEENLIFNGDMEYYPETVSDFDQKLQKFGWYVNYQYTQKLEHYLHLAEQYNVAYDMIISMGYQDLVSALDPAIDGAGRTEHFFPIPLDNETYLEAAKVYTQMLVDFAKKSKAVVSVCLTNEPKVYSYQGDYYIPHWQNFLKERYNNSIDNLNATYGSSYKSFEEVKMPTGIIAKPVYTDYSDFNDGLLLEFHKTLTADVKEVNQDLFVHSKIMQYFRDIWARYFAMGTNYELTPQFQDVNGCDAWTQVGGSSITDKMAWHDMLTSINNKPVWNTEDHNTTDGNPPTYPDIEPYHCATDLWSCALHGLGFSAIWWMEVRPNIMPWAGAAASVASSNAMHKPLRMWETSKATFDLNRLSKQIAAIQKKEERIGILYSRLSSSYNPNFYSYTSDAYEDCIFSGQRVGFVHDTTPEDVLKYDLFIVPEGTHVKADLLVNIKKMIEQGGKVLLLGENSLLKDEYDKEQDKALVDFIYKHADTTSTVREKIEELGYSEVQVVDAETGGKLNNVEWSYAEYEGKTVVNITNFDYEKKANIKILYQGKEVTKFTELRSMEEIDGTYTLLPLRPIFVEF
ncbi:MAG: beta-galactosidase [Clostridia bacterium]|nr:beta-galactosidase [Clostridia bacterium]